MRRKLEILALAGFVALMAITAWAMWGPHPLPPRIAIHFDWEGRPNGWGAPATLWLLPGIAAFTYIVTTLVSRFPASFNYPVSVTAANRPRLEEISLDMISVLKAELMILFALLQQAIIMSAIRGTLALLPWLVPVFLAAVLGTIAWFWIAMVKAARASQ